MSKVSTIKIKNGDDVVIINESDFDPKIHQLADGETAPNNITVTLDLETSPELQKVIDETKAECEKVLAENIELQEQLDKERKAVQQLTAEVQGIETERDALSTRVKEIDLENAELKESLAKATAKTTKAAKAEIKE